MTIYNMKNLFLFISLIVLSISNCFSQNSLEVTVKNIKGNKGSIRIGLFNNQQDFLKKVIDGKIVKPEGTQVTVIFKDLPAGDYAVSVIHDENENGELDRSKIGVPKEGFAFGNNAFGKFAPPTFDAAKITLSEKPAIQVVNMKYF